MRMLYVVADAPRQLEAEMGRSAVRLPLAGGTGHYLNRRVERSGGVLELLEAFRTA